MTLDLTKRCGGGRCSYAPGEGHFGGIAAYAATYLRRISSKCQGSVVGGGSAERHCRRTMYRSRGFFDEYVARDHTYLAIVLFILRRKWEKKVLTVT